MGRYANVNGVLTPIAGRGKAEYGASTVRSGSGSSQVDPNNYTLVTISFDSAMPDADYEVEFWTSGQAAQLFTVYEKSTTGFKFSVSNLNTPTGTGAIIYYKWKAFKLYTDNEYNSIKNSVSDNPDYTRNLLVNPLDLERESIDLEVAGFEDPLTCEGWRGGPVLIRYANGTSTEDAEIPIVPKDKPATILNDMLFEVGKEYIFSVQPYYDNPFESERIPDLSQMFELKARYLQTPSKEVDIPFTVVDSDRPDRLAIRFTAISDAASTYGYLNPYGGADPLYTRDDHVYIALYFVIKSGFNFDDYLYTHPEKIPESWIQEDGIIIKSMVQNAPPAGIPVDLAYRDYISTPEDHFFFRRKDITTTADWGGAKFVFVKIGRIVYVMLASTALKIPTTIPSGQVEIGTLPYDFRPLLTTGFHIISTHPQTGAQVKMTITTEIVPKVKLSVASGTAGQAFASDEQLGSYVALD